MSDESTFGPPPSDPSRPVREPDILATTRASDADRNAVNRHLQDAFADGRLDEEEFDVRMHRALIARTRQDLDAMVVDLGLPQQQAGTPPVSAPSAPVASWGQYGSSTAILTGITRKGRWVVPAELSALAILGDVKLDLRAATLSSPVTTIKAQAILGEVTLIVPPGVRVEVDGTPILGDVTERVDNADLPPDAPLVRVQALVLLGEFTARTKAPGSPDRWWRKLFGS